MNDTHSPSRAIGDGPLYGPDLALEAKRVASGRIGVDTCQRMPYYCHMTTDEEITQRLHVLLDSISEPILPVPAGRKVSCPVCTSDRDFDDPAECPECAGDRWVVL